MLLVALLLRLSSVPSEWSVRDMLPMARHKPNHNSDPFVTTATENCHLLSTAPGKETELSTLPHSLTVTGEVASPGGSAALCSCQRPWMLWSTWLVWELGAGRVAQGCPSTPESHTHNLLRAPDPTTNLTFNSFHQIPCWSEQCFAVLTSFCATQPSPPASPPLLQLLLHPSH